MPTQNEARRRPNIVRERLARSNSSGDEETLPEWLSSFCWGSGLIMLDLIAYGFLVPLISALVGGRVSVLLKLNMGPVSETLIVIFCVFFILSFLFKWGQESTFWKQFFSGEVRFKRILQIRDGVNTLCLVYLCYKLLKVVQIIIEDKGMISKNLHQGILFVTLRRFVKDEDQLERDYSIKPMYHPRYYNPNFEKNPFPREAPLLADIHKNPIFAFWHAFLDMFGLNYYNSFEEVRDDMSDDIRVLQIRTQAIHSAEFLLITAQLTAALTKLMYFNSLYAYHRSMDIFVSMQQDGELDSSGPRNEDDYTVTYDDVRVEAAANPVTIHKKEILKGFLHKKQVPPQPQPPENNDEISENKLKPGITVIPKNDTKNGF